jgi:hypothetical protein
MFISNKTVNLIKIVGVITLSVLLMIIAGQSVLYIKVYSESSKKIVEMQYQLDSLKVSNLQAKEQSSLDKIGTTHTLTELSRMIDSIGNDAKNLKTSSDVNSFHVELLIENECQVTPYYMDKRLREICKEKNINN